MFTDTTYIIIKLKGTACTQVERRNTVNVGMEMYIVLELYMPILNKLLFKLILITEAVTKTDTVHIYFGATYKSFMPFIGIHKTVKSK
jgi:hypothetical protein